MNGGDGIILSKRGDICIGWTLRLPPAFRCNGEMYKKMVDTMSSAIALLPPYTILHKQDIYFKKRYSPSPANGFLQEAYERHFEGREYLEHVCRIFLTLSSKKNIKSATSGLSGIIGASLPKPEDISRFLSEADQFEAVLGACDLMRIERLNEKDIFGEGNRPGLLQQILCFSFTDEDVLYDIQVERDSITIGDRKVYCHLISDLDQIPSDIDPFRKISSMSTSSTDILMSYFGEIGQSLDCEHVVNQFIMKEPSQEILSALDTKRRKMRSLSAKSAPNKVYSDEIGQYMEESAAKGTLTVKAYVNILSSARADAGAKARDKVTGSIAKMGVTPIVDTYDAPCQFWASLPGNEAGIPYEEYMTMEAGSSLCLWNWDGDEMGIPGGTLKMSDRVKLIPQSFDLQGKAMDMELITNYNAFLLGPSGSGKSFFMNKFLSSCYHSGEQCFLIDVGDSYRALCKIINEESEGRDGVYYTFEKGRPISFNPFRRRERFKDDTMAQNFIVSLLGTLWKIGGGITTAEENQIRDSVTLFISGWNKKEDPIFDDYFTFVQKEFPQYLQKENVTKEYFDITAYINALKQFRGNGNYGYLLNSREDIDILSNRFVVIELDRIKDDKVLYPITTLIITDAFNEKMTYTEGFKVMVIEEAWKAMMGTNMATYMLELWKTARKKKTAAMLVSQELSDVTSSSIIKDSILENSAVKILLDQRKYVNRIDELARALSLSKEDIALVMSLNTCNPTAPGREAFFNLGGKKSFVMRLEVSAEEAVAFSSKAEDRAQLRKRAEELGSWRKAVEEIASWKRSRRKAAMNKS